eukprot:1401132-Rhodomonas_salina.2
MCCPEGILGPMRVLSSGSWWVRRCWSESGGADSRPRQRVPPQPLQSALKQETVSTHSFRPRALTLFHQPRALTLSIDREPSPSLISREPSPSLSAAASAHALEESGEVTREWWGAGWTLSAGTASTGTKSPSRCARRRQTDRQTDTHTKYTH